MKRLTKIISLILVLVLIVGTAAGCGRKTDDGEGENKPNSSDDKKDNNKEEKEQPEFVYVAEYSELKSDFEYMNTIAIGGDKMYFTSTVVSGQETYTDELTGEEYTYDLYETKMFSMNIDGTDLTELSGYAPIEIPEGKEGGAYLQNLSANKNGDLWALENVYTYSFDLPEGFDPEAEDRWNYYVEGEDAFIIRRLDATGAEIASINTGDFKGDADYFYVNYFICGDDGNLYFTTGDTGVYVLSPEGELICKIESEDWVSSLVSIEGKGVLAMMQTWDEKDGTYSNKFVPIDIEAKAWGEPMPAPDYAYDIIPGTSGSEYDLYYNYSTSFYGYKFDTGESTKLFSWINIDVDNYNISGITPRADGSIMCISTTWDDNGEYTNELISITKRDAASVPQKETITLACMGLDWNLRSNVLKFNKSNDKIRVEIADYSEYNTEEDYTAGTTKLSTEILSGNVPDLICTNGLPVSRYAARGYLEDLWSYIENDPELGRDGVIEPVFKAMEKDGKLYEITSDFYIMTAVGPAQLVGDKMGWSVDELMNAYNQLPEGASIFSQYYTRPSIMSTCCNMLLENLVNWSTGECRFDSEEFISTLKFAQLFPEEYNWELENPMDEPIYEDELTRVRNGKQLLMEASLSTPTTIQLYDKMFNNNATFVGFPTSSGNGAAFGISTTLAMSSTCSNKEAAWEFMRVLLDEEYQTENVWSFPTNKAVFDSKIAEAMKETFYTDFETGEEVPAVKDSWWISEEESIEVYAITQADVDKLMELINTTENISTYDETIYETVYDAAAPFFAGQKSAEEVAKLVQSKMSLYVNEQR